MWLVGCTYNFCWPHHELSRQRKQNLTPAMASGLTDHPWSVRELLAHRIAPPAWNPPKAARAASEIWLSSSDSSGQAADWPAPLEKGRLMPIHQITGLYPLLCLYTKISDRVLYVPLVPVLPTFCHNCSIGFVVRDNPIQHAQDR